MAVVVGVTSASFAPTPVGEQSSGRSAASVHARAAASALVRHTSSCALAAKGSASPAPIGASGCGNNRIAR
jgi:uncharacterized protein (UPF0333 family)